jgi:hypothetical protein
MYLVVTVRFLIVVIRAKKIKDVDSVIVIELSALSANSVLKGNRLSTIFNIMLYGVLPDNSELEVTNKSDEV